MASCVDAIIPVYREPPENLVRTVEALLSQERSLHRVVVVDDGSPVPVAVPEQIARRVELLRLEQNVGISATRNHAASASSADFLLFVNCDVVLRSNWVRAAVAFMESHPRAAVVGGAIVPQVGPHLFRRWRLRFLENPAQRPSEELELTWVAGHATLMRRRMFAEVGGFDPRHRVSAEEYELCTRLKARGYCVYHLPQLVADSYETPSIDLFARKTLRNSGWDVRLATIDPRPEAIDVRPVQLLPASVSVLRDLGSRLGRNLYKRRLSFLPIDAAVAARSLFLVWTVGSRPRGRTR